MKKTNNILSIFLTFLTIVMGFVTYYLYATKVEISKVVIYPYGLYMTLICLILMYSIKPNTEPITATAMPARSKL